MHHGCYVKAAPDIYQVAGACILLVLREGWGSEEEFRVLYHGGDGISQWEDIHAKRDGVQLGRKRGELQPMQRAQPFSTRASIGH